MRLGEALIFIKNGAVITQREGTSGLPITRIETLSNGCFNRDRMGYADVTSADDYEDFILEDKDLLMSHINSKDFVGRTVLYEKEGDEQIIHGMNLLRIKTNPDILDSVFAYYWFQSPYFRKSIFSIRKDAVNQSSASITDIVNIELKGLPSIEKQKEIANVLSTIDRLIAKNNKTNETLSNYIRLIYDYWFVQFDFPNSEGKPYKKSGGQMVYNEDLKMEIPLNWEVKQINELLSKERLANGIDSKEYLSHGKYKIIDQGPKDIVGFTNDDTCLNHKFPAILFGDHSTCVKFINHEFVRGADGTQIMYSNDERVPMYYFYQVVKHLQIPNQGYSRHYKYVKEMPIILPQLKISSSFEEMAKKIYSKQTVLQDYNIKLSELRDKLLPLLMNGQVTYQNQ